MATPYATGGAPVVQQSNMQKWYDQQHKNGTEELRSVTPAMNNTRGSFRSGHDNTSGFGAGPSNAQPRYDSRSGTPNRYLGAYNSADATTPMGMSPPPDTPSHQPPSSTGLIRLSLRKPMGIVFEPMYDPNNPSLQRGVRICDLPRTGAAALSRKLEVGDELLSINDKTMSRLTFDEIMDFIIEADPEEVNLLFRRPRKEILQARQGIKKPMGNSAPAVKWVDDDVRNKKKDKKKDTRKSEKKASRRSKKEEEDTITSADEDYRRGTSRKKGRPRKNRFESESFLDLLIDTICANPDNACRERRRGDDEYYSDEDEDGTFASQDDSTYVTYESEEQNKRRGKGKKREDSSLDEETDQDTVEERWKRKQKKEREMVREMARAKSPAKEKQRSKTPEPVKVEEKYEDDGTLETVDSQDRIKPVIAEPGPLGLTGETQEQPVINMVPPPMLEEDVVNPAPIRELEYDDGIDHGADVSVMESLGGPSLLIEKQRQAQAMKPAVISGPVVPSEIIENFSKDYPVTFGLTHEQTIQADPLKFYTFVVKNLLEEHEPEKVRLLDKLLAKYKGREDHLVQKLSVRYNKAVEDNELQQEQEPPAPVLPAPVEEEPEQSFTEAVQKNKDSPTAVNAVNQAKQQMLQTTTADVQFETEKWPEKETKEPDEGDSQDEQSRSESDFSRDSIDGTSPAVIAQVSELLNYVYGKTSVPGQIDRVSTIMRAYEGREAVLLELLETKALIKANKEKENVDNLPSFLRNSQAIQYNDEMNGTSDGPAVTPMATQQQLGSGGGTLINDDISSMSGVSSPAEGQQQPMLVQDMDPEMMAAAHHHDQGESDIHRGKRPVSDKKKKKGLFGGLFGKKGKKGKDTALASPPNEALRSGSRSRQNRRNLKNARSAEVSI